MRYDQLMHIISYFVLTLFIYSVVLSLSNKKANKFALGLIVVLAGVGLGAINEIIEFGTVVFFNTTVVGDYYNNALDLVFNALGALIAILFVGKK